MAIITFKSNEIKETGQTLSIAAVATKMAIDHNYKILVISTDFQDQTIDDCFWEVEKSPKLFSGFMQPATVGVQSGIDELVRVIASNKTNPRNYQKLF